MSRYCKHGNISDMCMIGECDPRFGLPPIPSHDEVVAELNQRLIDRTAAFMEKVRVLEVALKRAESTLQFWMEHNRDSESPVLMAGRDTLEAIRIVKQALGRYPHENP